MKKPSTRTELRIVNQVRTMHLRGYEFACESAKLRLDIAPVQNDGPGMWRVEARVRTGDRSDETTANEVGTSRTEALRAVAKTWRDKEEEHGIRVFDWDAVEALLVDVHAL